MQESLRGIVSIEFTSTTKCSRGRTQPARSSTSGRLELNCNDLFVVLRPLVRHLLAKRREREQMYSSASPFEASFLELDRRNSQLQWPDIVRVQFRRNRSLRAAYSVGSVAFWMFDGAKRRLILVSGQQQDDILTLLERFYPAIEVIGKPNLLTPPKPPTPAQRRTSYIVIAGALFMFAALFGYVGLRGINKNPILLPLAALNIFVGLRCSWKAWKTRPSEITADA